MEMKEFCEPITDRYGDSLKEPEEKPTMKMPKTIPCKAMFINDSEFEWFIETQCEKCKRLRNGKCRIYNACFDAQYDASKFPYGDLLDYADGYAGKRCKHFTNKPIERKRRNHIVKGQLEMEVIQ